MLVRPRDFADRISGTQQPKIFRLPIDAARCKAREASTKFRRAVICRLPKTGGRFPMVRSSSRCDACRLRIELKAAVPKRIGI